MESGSVRAVTAGDCTDLYYLDTGMYDADGYGAVYVLDDDDRPSSSKPDRHQPRADPRGAYRTRHRSRRTGGDRGHPRPSGPRRRRGFARACPNADVYVPAVGASHLADPSALVAGTKAAVGDQWEFYTEPEPVPEDRVVEIEDGDVIDFGDHELRVHEAPGHAFHQVVFADPENDAVFTGDAAGLWAPEHERIVETSPPSDFDLEQCLADLETIAEIDPDVLCYTHFGPREVGDDLDRALEEYATVLEEWVADVAAAREECEDDEAVVEQFAASTDLGEVWNERKASAEAAMNARGVLGYLDDRD